MDDRSSPAKASFLTDYPSNLNGSFRRLIDLLGRILLCSLFFISSFNHVKDWHETTSVMAHELGLPFPHVLLASAMVVELLGGMAFVIGWRPQLAALAMAIFTIVASTLFHLHPQVEVEMHMFFKDVAICGALLSFAVRPWPNYDSV